jgi:hypothetical protein
MRVTYMVLKDTAAEIFKTKSQAISLTGLVASKIFSVALSKLLQARSSVRPDLFKDKRVRADIGRKNV